MTVERDYDVVVVGSGIAGHCAALEAVDAGARVLMVEAEDKIGGSTRLSSGILMGANTRYQRSQDITEDSPEKFLRHYMDANNWRVQPSIARRFCYEAGPTMDWLETKGLAFQGIMSSGSEEWPRGHITGGGDRIIEALAARLQSDRVDVVLKTRVTRLDIKDGAVTGIYAAGDHVSAGAVVLASGGIGANSEMVRRWHPEVFTIGAQPPRYLGSPGCRGDAIVFAEQMNAQVATGIGFLGPFYGFGGGYLPRYALLVNALGHRFMNEAWSYGAAVAVLSEQPGAMGYCVFDHAAKQAMKTRADVMRELTVIPPDEEMAAGFISSAVDDSVAQGLIMKADTLEQLAHRLALPLEAFLGSVTRYNRLCADGFDADYLKNTKLRPVATGPFYAFPLRLGAFPLTSTGVRIDHNAGVLHQNSDAIPGLFAAGECTGGIIVKVYVGSGNSLTNGSTFGRIAGRNAAAYARTRSVPPVDWQVLGVQETAAHT